MTWFSLADIAMFKQEPSTSLVDTWKRGWQRMRSSEAAATSSSSYWSQRKASPLYREVIAAARREASDALTALDVGAYESPLLTQFDWIPTKVALDVQSRTQVWNQMRGVAFLRGDFMAQHFVTPFDLVVCCQVVEHLPDSLVGRFVTKLASHARVLIVSTTFQLPSGAINGRNPARVELALFRSFAARARTRGSDD